MRRFAPFSIAASVFSFITSLAAFAESSITTQRNEDLSYSTIEKRIPRGWFTCDLLEIVADTEAPGNDQGTASTVYVGRSRPLGTHRATQNVAIKVVNIHQHENEYEYITLPIPAAEIVRQQFNTIRGISAIYDTCERDGQQIVVTELMYGQTLKSLVQRGVYHGNDGLVGDHFEQALDTMRAFHQRGYALVDFHLGNMMLTEATEGFGDVKMIDHDEITFSSGFHGVARVAIYIASPGE